MTSSDNPDEKQSPPPAQPRPGDPLLGWLLLASAALLLLGWTLPVMTIKTLYFFDDELSILQAMFRLWESGETLLFMIVAVFTLAFPLLKLAVAFFAWQHAKPDDRKLRAALNWIERLGRWSMLDVFVTALIIVVVKISFVSDAEVHFGLYIFAAAVILSMITVRRVAHLTRMDMEALASTPSRQKPENNR